MPEVRPAVREVLRLVEEVSGVPVVVQEDRTMRLAGTVRMARRGAPAHVITFNPAFASPADYVIAFQCGFILRLFANPPDQRLDLAATTRGRELVHQLLTAPDGPAKKMNLPPDVVDRLRDQLFDGLMTQLRSMPVGLRIDTWILEHHAELASLQRDEIIRQLRENLTTLGPDVRKIAPTKVYKASVTMNAAFATFWARRWNDDSLVVPYASGGFRKPAAELLAALDNVGADAVHDRELIDAWGTTLRLSTWYQWVPYDAAG